MKVKFSLLVLVIIFSLSIPNIAQFNNHIHRVTTWKMVVHENGSEKELKQLLNEWIEKIGKKNYKILHFKIVKDKNNKNEYQFIVTDEHSNWDVFEVNNKERKEFVEIAWPDQDTRMHFFNKLKNYIGSHTEELYEIHDNYYK